MKTESDTETPHHVIDNIIYGPKSPISNMLYLARRIARSSSPVLITGATGIGKENLAHYIHNAGTNPDAPFIGLNCSAVPEKLFESELFGHVRDAFSETVSLPPRTGTLRPCPERACSGKIYSIGWQSFLSKFRVCAKKG